MWCNRNVSIVISVEGNVVVPYTSNMNRVNAITKFRVFLINYTVLMLT